MDEREARAVASVASVGLSSRAKEVWRLDMRESEEGKGGKEERGKRGIELRMI